MMEVVLCICVTVIASSSMQDSDRHHAACCIHVWHQPRDYWQPPVHDGPGAAHYGQVKLPASPFLWPWIIVLHYVPPLFRLLSVNFLIIVACNPCDLSVRVTSPILTVTDASNDNISHCFTIVKQLDAAHRITYFLSLPPCTECEFLP